MEKFEILAKLEEKGISIPQAAKAIEFDPTILSLYFAKDSFPVPGRILAKLAEVANN